MRKLIGGNYGFKRTYRIKNNFFIRNSDNLFPSGRSAFISLVEYLFKKNNLSKIEILPFYVKVLLNLYIDITLIIHFTLLTKNLN